MHSIDVNEATRIASEAIAETDPGYDLTLRPELTREYEFGWAFQYAPRRWIETGDVQYQVPGCGPVVVERDREVTFLSSSGPPERVIEAFLESWRGGRP